MMAASTQWEVVGKTTKKHKKNTNHQSGKLTKNQIRSFIENMPTVKELAPVKESPTIFDAFLQKEAREESKKTLSAKDAKSSNTNHENHSKKSNQAKKKQQQQEKKKEPEKPTQSLEEAVAKLKIDEIHTFVTLVQERFPSTPLIWLKDLVTYLNLKLNVEGLDPLFSGKAVDYPLSLLSPEIHQLILEVFEKCPEPVLQLFFEHIVTNLVEDTAKGHSTNGYRVIIQSLAFSKPAVTLNNLQKYKDLRAQYQNRHSVCLSLLWALGQGGVKDLTCGIKIWLEMMLPVLGMRAYSKYTIDYLDVLFRVHSDVQACDKVLGIREFFPVLDLIFSHSANLPPNLHKQLLGLYPKLKTVAFGPNPEQILRNYFPSFLLRLVPTCPLVFKNELQTCLMICLATDKHCYSVWRQLYTKHLVQSSLLLQHIAENWDALSVGLPKKLLKETIGTFCVTNDELGCQSKPHAEGYEECVKACEILLRKMSVAAMFPWRLIFVLFVTLIGSMLAYDITIHGSFQASTTGRVLQDYGVMSVCEHAWMRIKIFPLKAYRWSEENVPIYIGKLVDFLNPYIKLFWHQLYISGMYIVEQTAEVREYLNQKLPQLLKWINDNVPTILQKKSEIFWDIWSRLQQGLLICWTSSAHHTHNLGTWLQENVFTGKLSPESLQKCTKDTVEIVQQYTTAAYQWMSQQMAAFTAGK